MLGSRPGALSNVIPQSCHFYHDPTKIIKSKLNTVLKGKSRQLFLQHTAPAPPVITVESTFGSHIFISSHLSNIGLRPLGIFSWKEKNVTIRTSVTTLQSYYDSDDQASTGKYVGSSFPLCSCSSSSFCR